MSETGFNCTKCGACCRALTKEHCDMLGLPLHESGKGCANLVNNECIIYAERPVFCSVNEYFHTFDMKMKKEEWFKLNEEKCKELQDQEKEGG